MQCLADLCHGEERVIETFSFFGIFPTVQYVLQVSTAANGLHSDRKEEPEYQRELYESGAPV